MINLPMRILVMFDLPTITEENKKAYVKYRQNLIQLGYYMLQFSIYVKSTKNKEDLDGKLRILNKLTPPEGSIRILTITDKQYQKMIVVLGEEQNWEKMISNKETTIFF